MKYSKLGSSDLSVSRVCLGSMTWGQQNTEAEGHEQIDYALDQGVNFIDTAELYSVPTLPTTHGETEKIIGTWFQKNNRREKVILATKIAGCNVPWVREGKGISGQAVKEAVEGSLARLQTDYIDLYQLHWPNRVFPHFGRNHAGLLDFKAEDNKGIEDNLLDILSSLGELVKEGKIRHIGLSDDTAWGISKYLELAKEHSLPRLTSIQNEFSLLNRSDDPYVAETCVRENVAYLPWSPLAMGFLSGKYTNQQWPKNSRYQVAKDIGSDCGSYRDCEQTHAAVLEYIEIAKKHDLDVCDMALAFCNQQRFVTSTIIGATSMEQLTSNIAAFEITLSADVLKEIDVIYRKYPLPF